MRRRYSAFGRWLRRYKAKNGPDWGQKFALACCYQQMASERAEDE